MGSKTQKEHGNSTHPTFLLSVFWEILVSAIFFSSVFFIISPVMRRMRYRFCPYRQNFSSYFIIWWMQ